MLNTLLPKIQFYLVSTSNKIPIQTYNEDMDNILPRAPLFEICGFVISCLVSMCNALAQLVQFIECVLYGRKHNTEGGQRFSFTHLTGSSY